MVRQIDFIRLGALALMWGSAFLLTHFALQSLPAASVAWLRIAVATLVLHFLCVLQREPIPRDPALWLRFAWLGLIGAACPFFLIGWGQERVPSGLAGILMAVMPLFTLLLAPLFGEREESHPRRFVGFICGFLGVVLLAGPSALLAWSGEGSLLLRQCAILSGAICYAFNAHFIRRLPRQLSTLSMSACMSLCACVWMLPLFLSEWAQWQRPDFVGLISIVGLGLFPTALATVMHVQLIHSAGAGFFSLTNYLIPPIAVVLGILFAGESFEWRSLLAMAIILFGIAQATGIRWKR